MLQPDPLVRRIEILERQNRWLKRVGIAVVAAFAGLILVAAADRQPNELKVNSLVITSADGKPAILIHAPKGNAEIDIYDVSAKRPTPQISIGCIPADRGGGSQIFMHGSNGQKAVNIIAQEKGNVATW